jgi:hypothetical protein
METHKKIFKNEMSGLHPLENNELDNRPKMRIVADPTQAEFP